MVWLKIEKSVLNIRGISVSWMLVLNRYLLSVQLCVEFYYHMFGPNVGTLNLYRLIPNGNKRWKFWSRTGSSGNKYRVT